MAGIVSLAVHPPRTRRAPRRRHIRKHALRSLKFLQAVSVAENSLAHEIHRLSAQIENETADRFRQRWGFDIKAGQPVQDPPSQWKWTEL